MPILNTYLNFNGNTEEAFNFYKSILGGEFQSVMRWKEMPQSDEMPEYKIPENEKEKIMHIGLPIGDSNYLMGTDSLESMGHKTTFGDNFHIALGLDSKKEADRVFKALSEGGNVVMPMADAFWGDYFGMVTDKFGIQWMLSYTAQS